MRVRYIREQEIKVHLGAGGDFLSSKGKGSRVMVIIVRVNIS